jgi:hypothetical protein
MILRKGLKVGTDKIYMRLKMGLEIRKLSSFMWKIIGPKHESCPYEGFTRTAFALQTALSTSGGQNA